MAAFSCREPQIKTPKILFGGCTEVTSAGVCRVVSTSTLTVWTEGQHKPSIFLGRKKVVGASSFVEGGHRHRIPVDHQRQRLTARHKPYGTIWSLSIEPYSQRPELLKARRLRRRGQFKSAIETVAPLLSHSDVGIQARAASLRARLSFSLDDYETAADRLLESIALHRQAGSRSGELDDRLARIFMLRRLGRFEEALRAKSNLDDLVVDYPTGKIRADFFNLNEAVENHDYRRALEIGPALIRDIERIDEPSFGRVTRGRILETLAHLGRHDDAQVIVSKLIEDIPAGPPCVRASHGTFAGHAAARLAQDTESRQRARRVLQATAAVHQSGCTQAKPASFVRALLGLLAVAEGDIESAKAHLDGSIALNPPFGRLAALSQSRLMARVAA
ncbi:MAG: tetratricopeptide repeat protein, partial [Myxococcota bacterium]